MKSIEKVEPIAFDDPRYLLEPVKPEPSFFIEERDDMTEYKSLADAVNAMTDLQEIEVENVFEILRGASSIAKESRRGMGNFICTNDSHDAFGKLPAYFTLLHDEQCNGTFLMYRSTTNISFDAAILEIDGSFYIHPDYQRQVRRIIFK